MQWGSKFCLDNPNDFMFSNNKSSRATVTWRPATRKSAPVDGVVVAAHHRMDVRRAVGSLGVRIDHWAGPFCRIWSVFAFSVFPLQSILQANPQLRHEIFFLFTACTTCTKWNGKATTVALLDLDLYPRQHQPRIVSHCFGLGKGNLHSSKASYCTPQWHIPSPAGGWD